MKGKNINNNNKLTLFMYDYKWIAMFRKGASPSFKICQKRQKKTLKYQPISLRKIEKQIVRQEGRTKFEFGMVGFSIGIDWPIIKL